MLIASDIHFGANLQADVAMFLSAAEEEAKGQRLVVLPGDFTQHATPEEYDQAREFLTRLLGQGNRVVPTPGNHDFGVLRGERLPGIGAEARRRYRQLIAPALQQDDVLEARDTDLLLLAEEDAFLALRSTHRGTKKSLGLLRPGRIRTKQLDWAREVLTRHRRQLRGRRIHLVTHRSLWSDSEPALSDGDKHVPMRRRRRLEERILAFQPFCSFIHGHNHRPVLERCSTPKLGIELWRVGAPTLSERNLDQRTGPSPLAGRADHPRGFVRWDAPSGNAPELVPLD